MGKYGVLIFFSHFLSLDIEVSGVCVRDSRGVLLILFGHFSFAFLFLWPRSKKCLSHCWYPASL